MLSVGAGALEPNPATAAIAPFSSDGLALDGGVKPEVAAPGVGLATSDPGRNQGGTARYGAISGTSAAAAVVAGAAASLAQARPELDAGALKAALVAASRPLGPGAAGHAGLVDPSAAAAAELVADPAAAGLGSALAADTDVGRTITLRNVSSRPLRLAVEAVRERERQSGKRVIKVAGVCGPTEQAAQTDLKDNAQFPEWLARNRPGGLSDSLKALEAARELYR